MSRIVYGLIQLAGNHCLHPRRTPGSNKEQLSMNYTDQTTGQNLLLAQLNPSNISKFLYEVCC